MRTLYAFFIAVLTLGLLDFLWLGNFMTAFYKAQFGLLGCKTMVGMGEKWPAMLATYFLMALGFAVFVFPRLHVDQALWINAGYGALFGLVLFGVYEGTNYVVFGDWPLLLVVVDTAWGMCAYAVTSVVAALAMRFF